MSRTTSRVLATTVATALLTTTSILAGTAPSTAAPTTAAPSAAPTTAAPTDRPAAQPRMGFGSPTDVSVLTNEYGMYVFATPVCSGYKSCRSWFRIPEQGIDAKDVTTTGGYFVAWPSTWREGQSVSSGYVHSFGRDIFGSGWYSKTSTSLGTITRPYSARAITARLTGQNDESRTASISGTATPGAEIRRNGALVARADQWGSWTTTVTGLPVGASTLWFDQFVDGEYHDRTSVAVEIAGQVVPATVTGPATVAPGIVNVVTGTATPGATFQVVDSAGNVIVPGGPFTVDATGKWSFAHLVPAGSTEFRFAIRQTAWGKPVTSELFTLPADTKSPLVAPAAE